MIMALMVESASEVLDVWDRGRGRAPWCRALEMLRWTLPPGDRDTAEALSIGDRDAALLALCAQLLGDEIEGVSTCTTCGGAAEMSLSAAEIGSSSRSSGASVSIADTTARIRAVTTHDLKAVAGLNAAAARLALVDRCVDDPDGVLGANPSEHLDAVCDALQEVDPDGDITIRIRCPVCEQENVALFDIVEFAWAAIEDWGQRVLLDVQLLAAGYGWTESDVLRLPEWRRRYYAEALGA